VNLLTRGGPVAAVGGTSVAEQLAEHPDPQDAIARLIEEEHLRSIFRLAAQEIREEFHEPTWQAFWMTTVEGASVERAAAALDKSRGAVYAARSRVMRRLKGKVVELDEASPPRADDESRE
jgi:RNA polymerase sigma-70 factor (ECF subfamily)